MSILQTRHDSQRFAEEDDDVVRRDVFHFALEQHVIRLETHATFPAAAHHRLLAATWRQRHMCANNLPESVA